MKQKPNYPICFALRKKSCKEGLVFYGYFSEIESFQPRIGTLPLPSKTAKSNYEIDSSLLLHLIFCFRFNTVI